MTTHIQAVSDLFFTSNAPAHYHLDQKSLNSLVVLLSYVLQAAVTNRNIKPEMPNMGNITQVLESDFPKDENTRNTVVSHSGCMSAPSTTDHVRVEGSTATKQKTQLVVDILQTASNLMLVRENIFSFV